jgi:hypothetical protein
MVVAVDGIHTTFPVAVRTAAVYPEPKVGLLAKIDPVVG